MLGHGDVLLPSRRHLQRQKNLFGVKSLLTLRFQYSQDKPKNLSTHQFGLTFSDVLAELALPVISKDKIFRKVDFGFLRQMGREFISRFDEAMFRSNAIEEENKKKGERTVEETFLFR